RARGGRRERGADRGPGVAEALRPHGGEGGDPVRRDGDQGASRCRCAALGRDAFIARSDALQVTGLEDTIARCNAYAAAGADLVFVDAPRTVEEYAAIAEQCSAPPVANMSETGRSPSIPTSDLEAMGYRLVIFPSTQTWLFAKAYEDLCHAV